MKRDARELFAARARAFGRKLARKGLDPSIAGVTFGLSDPHGGGQTVARVEFREAGVWFYKPRSGRQEQAWGRLLQRLNEARFSAPFALPEVRSRGTHCWMREVPHLPCRDFAEVERFYFRAGALLYLAHVLRAVDLHAGNFIAEGEQPVLIDCETFFHPQVALPADAPDQANSLYRTGMLPIGCAGSRHSCVSFLGRKAAGKHAVYLRRKRIRVSEMSEQLVGGFAAMHILLGRVWHLRDIRAAIERMRALPVRCIYRPTRIYARLRNEARRFTASEKARRYFLESQLTNGICQREIVRSETEQLLRWDIPIFHRSAAQPRRLLSIAEKEKAAAMIRESCRDRGSSG